MFGAMLLQKNQFYVKYQLHVQIAHRLSSSGIASSVNTLLYNCTRKTLTIRVGHCQIWFNLKYITKVVQICQCKMLHVSVQISQDYNLHFRLSHFLFPQNVKLYYP